MHLPSNGNLSSKRSAITGVKPVTASFNPSSLFVVDALASLPKPQFVRPTPRSPKKRSVGGAPTATMTSVYPTPTTTMSCSEEFLKLTHQSKKPRHGCVDGDTLSTSAAPEHDEYAAAVLVALSIGAQAKLNSPVSIPF